MHIEVKENLARLGENIKKGLVTSVMSGWSSLSRVIGSAPQPTPEADVPIQSDICDPPAKVVGCGNLNGGRRIDHVLQEKPIESFNEYLFSLGSHFTYWKSEDTVLFVLRSIYGEEI
eukprot:Opistho-2@75294